MVKITGDKAHKRRLGRIRGPAMVEGITQALYKGGADLVADAATSITAGAVSGAQHVPSAPGEPPNADTHGLSNSGEAVITGPLKVETSFNAPYAAAQELGSEKLNLPERPYMRPAAARNRPKITQRVLKAVDRVVAGG